MWDDDFQLKSFKLKKFFIVLFHLIFECIKVYCSTNLNRQSDYSRLRTNTSSLVVPTFDTKITENLCSGGFFSSDKFRLFY